MQSGLSPQTSEQISYWQTQEQEPYIFTTPHDDNDVEDASQAVQNFMEDGATGSEEAAAGAKERGKQEKTGVKEGKRRLNISMSIDCEEGMNLHRSQRREATETYD